MNFENYSEPCFVMGEVFFRLRQQHFYGNPFPNIPFRKYFCRLFVLLLINGVSSFAKMMKNLKIYPCPPFNCSMNHLR